MTKQQDEDNYEADIFNSPQDIARQQEHAIMTFHDVLPQIMTTVIVYEDLVIAESQMNLKGKCQLQLYNIGLQDTFYGCHTRKILLFNVQQKHGN